MNTLILSCNTGQGHNSCAAAIKEYFHRLGHRDVVYLGLRRGSVTHTLRHGGFLAAARELGMQVTTVENMQSGFTRKVFGFTLNSGK